MEMQEIYSIENNVLVGMKQPIISCYDDYLKHDYLIPEEVTAIKGKDFVPFAMNKFQITTNVKEIDWKAFGKCACIKKFVVVDASTKKVAFRKRFEINQGSCQNPNITLLQEFRKFVKGYPKNLTK